MGSAIAGAAGGTPKYRRVIVKLSGELVGGPEGRGISPEAVRSLSEQAVEVSRLGVQLALVIGGGNIVRGNQAAAHGVHRATADYMGMLGTIINALAIQDCIESLGVETRVMSAIKAEEVCEPYIRRRALRHLEQNRIVILAGGTGNPYFTTDTTAALRGMEVKAEVLLKATKVDGVYSTDPAADPNARKFDRLTYMEVLKRHLNVMDATAISLCMDNSLPIIVFSLKTPGNILRAIRGEAIGTFIGGEDYAP